MGFWPRKYFWMKKEDLMQVSREETEKLRDIASLYLRFNYDDQEIESWITMPHVLAVRLRA